MSAKCYELVYKNYGKCLCLDNGKIKLIATIEVGPRIVFFGFIGGENVLFEDTDRNFYEINSGYGVWYAYGGHRVWCAPETMPETYLPDNSKVEAVFEDNTLTLMPAKTKFGKQLSLVITMNDDDSVVVDNRITNCSDKPAEFAPWSVTGLAAGGTEIIPLCREDKGFLPNRTMSLWSYSDVRDQRFTLTDKYALLRQDPTARTRFKAGFNVTGKQIVYVNGRRIFRLHFDEYKKTEYPDFCCNFETFTNNLFLECELLGELRTYQPGETASLKERWELSVTDWNPEKVIDEFISKL